jgi:hypothetical protein
VLLSYDKGLDKYYGLIEMAIDAGIFEKKGSRIEAGGKSVYAKNILSNPEDYFTDEVMASLEEYAQRKYSYGKASGSEMASEDISSEVSS